jgi:polyphosphate kinase
VGRYLEHSRIYVFGRGEEQRVWIGCGDLLNRNTQRRVEAFAEVRDPELRRQVLEIMEAIRQDDVKGWDMQSDGTYRKSPEPRGEDSQERLYRFFTAQRIEPMPVKRRTGLRGLWERLRNRK